MANKYKRQLKGVEFDVYDVIHAFKVTNPVLQHAIKKLLMPGERGAKDAVQDLKEAMQAIERAIEMIEPEVNDKAQQNNVAEVKDFLDNMTMYPSAPDEIKYPCYMKLKSHEDVVEFTESRIGQVVIPDSYYFGFFSKHWLMDTFEPYTPTPEDNLPEL